jgi:hypothetical protein
LITGGAHRLGQLLVRSLRKRAGTSWCHYAAIEATLRRLLRAELRNAGMGAWTPWQQTWA